MNDRHPSGVSTPAAPASDASYGDYPAYGQTYEQQGATNGFAGYDGYATGTFDHLGTAFGASSDTYGGSYDTGSPSGGYDTYGGAHHAAYGTDQYDTGGYEAASMWPAAGYQPTVVGIPAPSEQDHAVTQHWDTTGWDTAVAPETGQWDTSSYATVDQEPGATPENHTAGTATGHNGAATGPGTGASGADGAGYDTGGYDINSCPTATWDTSAYAAAETQTFVALPLDEHITGVTHGTGFGGVAPAGEPGDDDAAPDAGPATAGAAAGGGRAASRAANRASSGRSGGRSRRRSPAKRSALLTVAVPSVAVMGVAGIAAASVSAGAGGDKEAAKTTQAVADPSAIKPAAANSKLDTQLASLTADADDFANRASRTQERIDLQQRQAEEKKRKEEEAARKEAMRPKFALPVSQHGLSAQYGQAGVNWMSLHTGIDFPVAYGTPVMAATDGTVRTQYNVAYGNMVILTAPDGTETWYCHLSSAKVRSGKVKAGDVIAYSGNSGNSTGPHLHFEVRPAGGSAVDPLPWLRSHGLDPT
ncbi:M23 family metallopeptidase [Streptomyces sp. URMC 123]|uniref:M23 family metallopeptidase n=1 Tax=Streptomyces sp. URMC 123 TaxID=3423403 RepID=UPI003F1D4994